MSRVRISIILSILLVVIFFGSIEVFAFDYIINDFNFYSIPNTPRPPKGVPFQDPIFHTNITRITDAPKDVPSTYGNYVFPGYPKHDIENANGTKLVLQSMKYPGWHIWNANPPYNKIKDLPVQIVNDLDPDVRWDSVDPSILYSTYGTIFCKYNVVTDQVTLLHDFKSDFPGKPVVRVYTAEEGDSSADSRYWFFKVRCNDPKHTPDPWWDTAVVVYDKDYYAKDKGKIIATLNETDPLWPNLGGWNYTGISFDGNWVWCTEAGTPSGTAIYPRDLSSRRDIAAGCGYFIEHHADRGISKEGRQVIFGESHRFAAGCGADMGYWYVMYDMVSGAVTWLSKGDGAISAFHISANSISTPGWGLISTYSPTYPADPTKWDDQSVYLVELTTRTSPVPRVWRLAHTHAIYTGVYGTEPFAKINKKGTKVWFGSDWRQRYQDPRAQYDVYQIDLPSNWYKDLMGNMPHTPPAPSTGLKTVK